MPYLSNDPTSQSAPSSPAFYRPRVQSTPAAEPMHSAPTLTTSATMSPPIKTDDVNSIDLHSGLWQRATPNPAPQEDTLSGQKVLWRNPKYGPPTSAPPAGPLPALPQRSRFSIIDLDEVDSMEKRVNSEREAPNPSLARHSRTESQSVEERKSLFAEQMRRNPAVQKAKEEADRAESKTVEQRKNGFAEQMKINSTAQKQIEEEAAWIERVEVVELGSKVEESDGAERANHRFVEMDGVEEGGVSEH